MKNKPLNHKTMLTADLATNLRWRVVGWRFGQDERGSRGDF